VGDITLWDTRDGRRLKRIPITAHSLAFSPDGSQLAATDVEGSIRRWDTTTLEELPRFQSPLGSLTQVRYSPDGKWMAAVDLNPTNAAALLIDVATVSTHRVLRGNNLRLHDVVFSPDSRRLFTAAADQTVRVWDAETGQLMATLPTLGQAVKLEFEPGGTRLAVVGNGVALWEGAPIEGERTVAGNSGLVEQVLFSPDSGRLLIAGRESVTRVCEVPGGQLLSRYPNLSTADRVMQFATDSRYVIATDIHTDAVSHWDVETGERVSLTNPPPPARAYNHRSPDGRHVAHRDGPTVRLISLAPPSERERERRRACTAPDLSWHEKEATDAEGIGFWTGVMFHRGRLALAEPWNSAAWVRHAEAATRVGMKRLAALSYLRAYLR
jgi:WD40 repeat protein